MVEADKKPAQEYARQGSSRRAKQKAWERTDQAIGDQRGEANGAVIAQLYGACKANHITANGGWQEVGGEQTGEGGARASEKETRTPPERRRIYQRRMTQKRERRIKRKANRI